MVVKVKDGIGLQMKSFKKKTNPFNDYQDPITTNASAKFNVKCQKVVKEMRKMILMENLSFQTFLPLHLLEQNTRINRWLA